MYLRKKNIKFFIKNKLNDFYFQIVWKDVFIVMSKSNFLGLKLQTKCLTLHSTVLWRDVVVGVMEMVAGTSESFFFGCPPRDKKGDFFRGCN